jgi:hypothetical protein
MGKKESKAISQFRLTWRTAKDSLPPAVLKLCDFNQGLGPALDKVAEKWDKAADLQTVPEDKAKALKAAVADVQSIIKKYHKQVIDGNQKLPRHGMAWFALQKTLRRLDEDMHGDLEDIDVEVATLPETMWKGKGDFDRGGNLPPTEHAPAPERKAKIALFSDDEGYGDFFAFCKLARRVEEKAGKPGAARKEIDDHARLVFPQSQTLAQKCLGLAQGLSDPVRFLEDKIAKKNKDGVPELVERLERVVADGFNQLPEDARELRAAVEEYIVKPLKEGAKKLTG